MFINPNIKPELDFFSITSNLDKTQNLKKESIEIELSPQRKSSFMQKENIKKYKAISVTAKAASNNNKNTITSNMNLQITSEKKDNLEISQNNFQIGTKLSLNNLDLNYSYLPSIESENKNKNEQEQLNELEIVYENLKNDIMNLKPYNIFLTIEFFLKITK